MIARTILRRLFGWACILFLPILYLNIEKWAESYGLDRGLTWMWETYMPTGYEHLSEYLTTPWVSYLALGVVTYAAGLWTDAILRRDIGRAGKEEISFVKTIRRNKPGDANTGPVTDIGVLIQASRDVHVVANILEGYRYVDGKPERWATAPILVSGQGTLQERRSATYFVPEGGTQEIILWHWIPKLQELRVNTRDDHPSLQSDFRSLPPGRYLIRLAVEGRPPGDSFRADEWYELVWRGRFEDYVFEPTQERPPSELWVVGHSDVGHL